MRRHALLITSALGLFASGARIEILIFFWLVRFVHARDAAGHRSSTSAGSSWASTALTNINVLWLPHYAESCPHAHWGWQPPLSLWSSSTTSSTVLALQNWPLWPLFLILRTKGLPVVRETGLLVADDHLLHGSLPVL